MFVVGLLFEKCSVKKSVRSESCNTINCKTIFSSNKLKFCVLVGNLDDDKSSRLHGHANPCCRCDGKDLVCE